ncbi:MAG: glycosyltransferase, partial [Acetatifactor sp.]|nr:glycosyltransferase [Acetatifactor sp.]
MRFSVVVVCLDPGDKLNQTLDSILAQTCTDYEVVVKDGGSRDGSVEAMRRDPR